MSANIPTGFHREWQSVFRFSLRVNLWECERTHRPVPPPSFSIHFLFGKNLLTRPHLRSPVKCMSPGWSLLSTGWFCSKILNQILQPFDIICSRAFCQKHQPKAKQTLSNLQIRTGRTAGELAQWLTRWLCKQEDLQEDCQSP